VPIRVVVVEDSLTVRRRICEILATDPDIAIVGEAGDGRQAVELCRTLRPSVMTLDMILPVMSGLSATEYVMAHFPTPILIVSSSTNRGELFKTYDALAAGAVDVLEKPRGDDTDAAWEQRLVAAVKIVSRIKVINHPRARLGALGRPSPPSWIPAAEAAPAPACHVIALGASTGGPAALVEVLRAVPPGVKVPMLTVLHIDEAFGAAFAEWLGDQVPHPVVSARDGDRLEALAGTVVLAPPGRHLVVQGGRLNLTSGPERHSCRPSIDVLFESLARDCGAATAACLLTGMGRDGAAGLLDVRRAGGLTIAQDEATSVVYGMPREAALLGAAERVLPLESIGASLAASIRESKRGEP
jgi:two-component system, chemotaxis family, protein-glutamate methylesterase/glutaminase